VLKVGQQRIVIARGWITTRIYEFDIQLLRVRHALNLNSAHTRQLENETVERIAAQQRPDIFNQIRANNRIPKLFRYRRNDKAFISVKIGGISPHGIASMIYPDLNLDRSAKKAASVRKASKPKFLDVEIPPARKSRGSVL